jgi:hypothetical protein
MNLIILILLPFVLLFFLNLQIYRKIKTFEQNLFAAHMRVCFTTNTSGPQSHQRNSSVRQVRDSLFKQKGLMTSSDKIVFSQVFVAWT